MSHTEYIQFWSQMKPVREALEKRLAECASPYPHLSARFIFPQGGALVSLLEAILINVYSTWNHGYWRDLALEKIFQRARNANFQGNWMLVKEYLQDIQNTEEKAFLFLRKHFHPRDIFGNLVPLMKRLSRCIRVGTPAPPRVRKPQRKRGYDDKGTLRLSHKWLPEQVHSGPNPDRLFEEHRRPTHPKEWVPKAKVSREQWEPDRVQEEVCHVEENSDTTPNSTTRREDGPARKTETILKISDRRPEIKRMNLF